MSPQDLTSSSPPLPVLGYSSPLPPLDPMQVCLPGVDDDHDGVAGKRRTASLHYFPHPGPWVPSARGCRVGTHVCGM